MEFAENISVGMANINMYLLAKTWVYKCQAILLKGKETYQVQNFTI